MMSKPLSALKNHHKELTDTEKQHFLPPKDLSKDLLTLHKVVTYRSDKDSLASSWSVLPTTNDDWYKYKTEHNIESEGLLYDFWNETSMNIYRVNYQRTMKGLYNLHWLLPNELPISLNI